MNHHAGGLFSFDLQEIFTFLFIMLGPIKLLVPFAKITKSSTEAERRSLALQGTLLATMTVIAASFVGVRILAKWGVAPGVSGVSRRGSVLSRRVVDGAQAVHGTRGRRRRGFIRPRSRRAPPRLQALR